MYEKIVNYFEEKMYIDNIYFRERHVLWIVGATVTLIVEILINFIIMVLNIDLWSKTIDIFTTAISLLTDIESSKKSFSVRKASTSKDGWVASNINSVNVTNERKEELKKLFKPELRTNQLKEMARHLKLVKKFLNLDLYAQKNK